MVSLQEAPEKARPGALHSRAAFSSLTFCTTSNSLALPGIPYALREGETARQMVFSVRLASATTRLVVSVKLPLDALNRCIEGF